MQLSRNEPSQCNKLAKHVTLWTDSCVLIVWRASHQRVPDVEIHVSDGSDWSAKFSHCWRRQRGAATGVPTQGWKNFLCATRHNGTTPKKQSPNWNQDLKPGRQSRTPKRTVAKRCKKNTRTGTRSEKCKTLCTYCTSKVPVFAEKLETSAHGSIWTISNVIVFFILRLLRVTGLIHDGGLSSTASCMPSQMTCSRTCLATDACRHAWWAADFKSFSIESCLNDVQPGKLEKTFS